MLTYRVSSVEAFRRWEADEDGDTDRLIADIRGGSPASPVMKAGTAFHKCLEDAIAGTDYESMSAQGHHFVFAGDFSIDLPQVRELRASHVYMVDGEPIRISGQVDTIDGRLVSDHKTTSRFDPERYLEGAQWKLYLDIFEADRFRWNVFEIKEVDGGAAPPDVCTIDGVVVAEDVFAPGAICYEVQRQHTLEQYRYPGMEDDCQHLVERFARFVREYIEAPALGVAA